MIDIWIISGDVHGDGKVERELTDPATIRAFNKALYEHRSDPGFCCLRFVDPYGDTFFNRLQMEKLSQELALIAERASTPEAREAVAAVQSFADEEREGVGLYLAFIGD